MINVVSTGQVWTKASAALRKELGEDAFGSWLAPAALRSQSDGALCLVTPTGIAKDWIRRNAWRRVEELWAAHDPDHRPLYLTSRVEFEASGEVCDDAAPPAEPLAAEPAKAEPAPRAAIKASRAGPIQERMTFETFVVGPSNEFAHAVARRVASWSDGHFNPVVIHGPYGFGKTHLLNAMAWAAQAAAPDRKVVYLTSERFLSCFVRAVMDRQTAAFKEDLRSADLLLIDDVHFIGGKQSSQDELFHTLAALMEDGRRVVFSSDRPPSGLAEVDGRLRSHLSAGLVCGVEPADRALRVGILDRKLKTLGRQLGVTHAIKPEILAIAEIAPVESQMVPGAISAMARISAATAWPCLATVMAILAAGPAPGGKLAVGTNRGFNLVDPASGAVERIFPDPSDPQGLSQGGVMSFAIDRHQRLWVGTDDAGIDVMTGRDRAGRPRFRHVGKADGLPDLDISKMMVDRLGRIWASTDHGLAVLDPDDFSARPLQAPQGVMVTSYWSTSGDQAANGDMIFGGAGGLTIVRPEQVSAWSFRPTVAITGVKLGGQALAPDSSGWKRAGARLEVPPDGNSLAVEFSALDFSAPELNRYAYRLDGFDTDWIETDAAHRVAAYTNLPPGQYTLRLRGSNREGLWSNDNAPLHIRVLPAWFQTGLFRAVVALAVILAVGALVQARTVFLRQRQRALERQVAERTAALRASQQELQAFAYLDTLTGLPNRRAFNEEFAKLIDAGGREAFALLLVDLDGFKTINDHLGHQAGDAVLAAAAARIRHAVRAGDFIARLGGDEFAIVMRGVEGRQPVNLLCERVVSGMAAPLCIGGSFVTVGASIGAALFPVHGRTQDELYRHVDLALYDAKRTGRGVWCWFDSGAEVKQEALF